MGMFGIRRETPQYMVFTGGAATVTASTTAYAPINGTTNFNATENNRQILVPRPMKVSSFVVVTGTSQPASGSLVLTLRKNAADTSIVITIPANQAAGTFTYSTTSVSFASGDLLSLKGVNNATGTSTALITWGIRTL